MAQRLSQLASELWPFLLPKVGAMVQGAGGGGGVSGGGTIGLHDLSGSLHKGTLADAQAPQFLLRSGARSLTGDLAVDAGVTIDGVDIGAHAVDPNAHHAKLHAITDAANHSVTGSQYQIVGLTAVNTLGLLTPSATPAANAVVKTNGSSAVTLVDLTVTSDLFMTGYLDFGTDTMYEDASYLQVAGSKAVRFGQNIGNANWTIYNAGGASFSGNVEVISGGDLTVVGSGSYAGSNVLFADSSGGNVGIMMAPDSQFALDINGPARATYWIGPHALQVKDALMICHYDGRQPFNTNFYGEPNGHMGQVAAISGGVIYCAGKFGKSAQMAKATTNYFVDPSCDYDATLSLWSKYTTGTFTVTRSTDVVPMYGTYVGNLVTVGSSGLLYQSLTMSATTISITAYVRKADKSAITVSDCQIHYNGDVTTTYTSMGDGWYRLRWSGTGTGTAVLAGIRVWSGRTVYVDALQIEYGNASPYCDGSLGTGHSWSGTAHASSSSRTAAALSYTLPTIDYTAPLTIMAWVNLDATPPENWQYLWFTYSDGYSAYRSNDGSLTLAGVASGTLPAGWVHLALVADGNGNHTAYVNGVSKGTAVISRGNLTTFYVGHNIGAYHCNGLIDDFAVIGRALPAAEIRSIYESNAPIFAETSTFAFRPTPKGLIWADDEGLWMRDTAGSPVLGAYGGEAATKSWAGFTMASGDIVIGSNAVGSSAIWWDKSAGSFGFYGSGNSTPQVTIATDGSLTAGAGSLILNSNGVEYAAPSAWASKDGYKFTYGGTINSGMFGYQTASVAVTSLWTNTTNGTSPVRTSVQGSLDIRAFAKQESAHIYMDARALNGSNVIDAQAQIVLHADYGVRSYIEIAGDTDLTGALDVSSTVRGSTIRADGDASGVASTTSLTNVNYAASGAGDGTIKMLGSSNYVNQVWIKFYVGTTAYYVPGWPYIS